jgi:hypothetical protein
MPQEDPAFVMGHVLLGTSQCLNPMSHQDSLDAFQHATKASEMVQAGQYAFCAPLAPSVIDEYQ